MRSDDGFGAGRAGMAYRDLLPDRWGGRFIASHIRIPGGGAVADVVHFHRIRFQMIFCARGWVDLVYEDQGPPFRLEAGDCVVQPPEIRHRVLQASVGLEVIEIGCPAVHDTFVEHSIELPTAVAVPDRSFGGQHFVRDVAAGADWSPWLIDGLSVAPHRSGDGHRRPRRRHGGARRLGAVRAVRRTLADARWRVRVRRGAPRAGGRHRRASRAIGAPSRWPRSTRSPCRPARRGSGRIGATTSSSSR